jgi:hypothetical protein
MNLAVEALDSIPTMRALIADTNRAASQSCPGLQYHELVRRELDG